MSTDRRKPQNKRGRRIGVFGGLKFRRGVFSEDASALVLHENQVFSGTYNLGLTTKNCLLARRVWRTHVHVAQVAQHGLVLFIHAAGKIRIVQMLVARRLRHILQYT